MSPKNLFLLKIHFFDAMWQLFAQCWFNNSVWKTFAECWVYIYMVGGLKNLAAHVFTKQFQISFPFSIRCFIDLLMAAFGIWYLQLISLTISNLKTDFNLSSHFHQRSKSLWSHYSSWPTKAEHSFSLSMVTTFANIYTGFWLPGSSPLLTLHLPTKTWRSDNEVQLS